MNSVRTCPNCKWDFPLVYTRQTCKFCFTEFPDRWCPRCKTFKPRDEFYTTGKGKPSSSCKLCFGTITKRTAKDRTKRFFDARHIAVQWQYDQWLEHIKDIKFTPMTDAEWMEMCRFFGGCAICGSENIDSRHFFLKFGKRGRYAAWNIFPMCFKCAVHTRKVENPFRWLDKYTGTAYDIGLNDERKEKLLEWFKLQVEKARDNGKTTISVQGVHQEPSGPV